MCMYRYNFFTVIKEKLRGATNCLPFQQIVVSRGFKHNIYIRYKSRVDQKVAYVVVSQVNCYCECDAFNKIIVVKTTSILNCFIMDLVQE